LNASPGRYSVAVGGRLVGVGAEAVIAAKVTATTVCTTSADGVGIAGEQAAIHAAIEKHTIAL
jgi:hypothetical protein